MISYIEQFLGFSLFDYFPQPLACTLYVLFALAAFDLFSHIFLYFWGYLFGHK